MSQPTYPTYLLGQSTRGNLPGITSLTWQGESSIGGWDLRGSSTLAHLAWPHLRTIDPDNVQAGGLALISNTGLLTISLPNLESVAGDLLIQGSASVEGVLLPKLASVLGELSISPMVGMTSLRLPQLSAVGPGTNLDFSDNTLLTDLQLPVFVPENGQDIDCSGCALTQTSVRALLARAVANAGYVTGTINISGGTNAVPSGQGATDVTTLTGRGVTVTHNS